MSSRTAVALVGGAAIAVAAAALLLRPEKAPAASQAPAADPYRDTVRPLLARHCYSCHGDKKQKAKLNLEAFRDEASIRKDRKTWSKVVDMMRSREMPPEEKPRLADGEVAAATGWIEEAVERLDPGVPRDPGRVVLRRLSRVEYRNTLRDLVGIDFDPESADFPSDDVGYGFDNVGDVLSLPPLLMEKYLAAAETIMDRAILPPEKLRPQTRRFEAELAPSPPPEIIADGDFAVLITQADLLQRVEVERAGTYQIRIRAAGDQAGPDPARMSLRVDGREIRRFDVPVARRRAKVYEEKAVLGTGTRSISVAFTNDFYNPAAKAKEQDRNLAIDWIEITGPVDPAPELPESHRRLLASMPGASIPKRDAAAENIRRFAARAFRRPVSADEVEKLVRIYELAEKEGDSFEAAMKAPLQAVLVSPHFLFRVERGEKAAGGIRALTGHEVATRLSYFLWSTLPDEPLLERAASGRLREPAVLEAEARRMLRDPRSKALAENFALQWLQLRRLEVHAPDPLKFPAWTPALRAALRDEAVMLFDGIVREDRSVLELLTCDETYLNEPLAAHYGIPGVKGPEMRKVKLTDGRRGGVLTLGAVLAVTSNPTRTSAVRRGKWVLETILGTPPPPPVPDAGELKDETDEDRKMSLRVRLEKHRADPNCASCHRRMDPIGFGFENFDPVGAWREKDGVHEIDSAAKLPDGSSFRGPVELKAVLAAMKDDFARCLIEKMAIYALGRGVEYEDAGEIRAIRKALAADGYRFSRLVVELVRSYPFLHRRDGGPEVKHE